jgi:hypothetical protein
MWKMNKKTLYNFLAYLPAFIILIALLIWVVLTSLSKTIMILALLILICLIILWEKYWIDKSFEVKNACQKS